MITPDSKQIVELRNAIFWTQEQLAEAAGLSVRTIRNVERGNNTSRETMMSVAAALNVSHYESLLIKGDSESPKEGAASDTLEKPSEKLLALSDMIGESGKQETLKLLSLVLSIVFAIPAVVFGSIYELSEQSLSLIAIPCCVPMYYCVWRTILFNKKLNAEIASLSREEKAYIARSLVATMHMKGADKAVDSGILKSIRGQALDIMSADNPKQAALSLKVALGAYAVNDDVEYRSIEAWHKTISEAVSRYNTKKDSAEAIGLSPLEIG